MIFQYIKDLMRVQKYKDEIQRLSTELSESEVKQDSLRIDLGKSIQELETSHEEIRVVSEALASCVADAKEMYTSNTVACIKYYAEIANREDLKYAATFTEQIVRNTLSKTHILEKSQS